MNVLKVREVMDRACRQEEEGRWLRIWRTISGGIVRSVGEGEHGEHEMRDMS